MYSERVNRLILNWLLVTCGLVVFMVLFGGTVRLTRSGLSIVEWNPVSGVVPPIGQEAWEGEFAKYQQTPEFQKVNKEMTLDGFKRIFVLEYVHRLVARFAGLVVAIPLLYFLVKGTIPWRRSALYVAIGLLFAFQGYLGWYMVSSGLVNRPAVSHYRLTAHLAAALVLLGLAYWAALNHRHRFPRRLLEGANRGRFALSLLLLLLLLVQIMYGGFMAGLKAGWVSNTWPLMFGVLAPQGMLSIQEPWWLNLLSSQTTVHFIHRWFALVVLLAALWLYWRTAGQPPTAAVRRAAGWMALLTACQVALGVAVIWLGVPIWLALSHQGLALALFLVALTIVYHLLHDVAPAVAAAPAGERISLMYDA